MARLLLRHGANPEDIMTPATKPATEDDCETAQMWAARRWPLTPIQHAFWDSDYEACDCLLEGGATLDEDTATWMIRVVLDHSFREVSRPALEFIETRAPDARRAALRNPLCFTIALRKQWVDLATEIWGHGLELSGFSRTLEKVDDMHRPFPVPFHKPAELGVLCLDAAVRCGSHFLLNGLLELGVGPIPPSALLLAVESTSDKILELLVKHGGLVHIRDDETSDEGGQEDDVDWHHLHGCLNPLKLAIKRGYSRGVGLLLKWSRHPVDPWFRAFYLTEACTRLRPETLACLLEHPSMHLSEADITGEIDVPLARLVRLADKLCSRYLRHHRDFIGPQSILRNIERWVACVAAFARAGVDAGMRDRAGRSALDYLREHMEYVGKNRFKRHLAAELRSIGGVEVGGWADPAACYEALGTLDIDLEECGRGHDTDSD